VRSDYNLRTGVQIYGQVDRKLSTKIFSRQISYWLIGYVTVAEVLRKARLSFSKAKWQLFRVMQQCGFAGE
jgi:hypothetical protein